MRLLSQKKIIRSLSKIWVLFKKDLLLEIRQQYAFYGVLLYVGATIFVLFMVLDSPEPKTWLSIFWVLQLFISINAVAKSFLQEGRGRQLYYYVIASPRQYILAKLLFNTVLMALMSGLSVVLFSLFLGYPVKQTRIFLTSVFLGGWSLSLVFTFLAAIAAKAQQNAAIMAILGFPIIIPQLVILIKISGLSFTQNVQLPWADLAILATSDVLVILLSVILFPFLWKD